jgi:hypothetical protein
MAQGNVAPISRVESDRALALTTNWTNWTKGGESDQRSAMRTTSGIRSKASSTAVVAAPIPIWISANVLGEARRVPHSQEYSALPAAIPTRKATSMALKA